MKTKPILTAIAGIILLAAMFFISACHHQEKADKGEITRFLDKFSDKLNQGDAAALQEMFEVKMSPKTLKKLLGLLTGKKDFASKEKPFANVTLDIDASDIKQISQDVLTANVQAELTHLAVEKRVSNITFKIRKISAGVYKIIRIDARKFLADYTEYANYIKSRTMSDKDLFAPITIAAFKTAAQLKTKYDSVIWFAHVNDKTYFYVVKGKWSMEKDIDRKNPFYKDSVVDSYKMGLVSPDLKEIIPAEYDLIHNINGTIDGLVEVEKDNKRGFYNLEGKLVLPVNYDQIFPLKNDENVALLRNGDDYFYLKKDFSITDKVAGIKLEDVLPQIKTYGDSFKLSEKDSKIIMEYNSRDKYTSIVIPPSYLVDMEILPVSIDFQNSLRHPSEEDYGDGEGNEYYDVKFEGSEKKEGNWFESIYYSVVDSYLGGRSGLYTTKHFVMLNKKENKLLSFSADSYFGKGEGGGDRSVNCHENSLRSIGDSLFEFKTTSELEFELYKEKDFVYDGPYYHYLHIKSGKLEAVHCERVFNCTKFVKMDDSYLDGCYTINDKTVDHLTPEILRYMKNEIFASYNYKFKDKRWNEVFQYSFNRDSIGKNISVDDSLTEIDKYNINWISQKLKGVKIIKPQSLAAR